MSDAQFAAVVSTIVIFLVNALLAMLLTKSYMENRKSRSYLIWSAGLRFFAIAIILEIMFAFGVYSSFLVRIYLLAIAIPILAFSIGHMQFIKSGRIKQYYYYYCTAISFLLIYTLFTSNIGNIINNYVVYGALPFAVYAASALITLSASAVLFFIALLYYKRKREIRMLAIIPGIVVYWMVNIIHIEVSQLFIYYLQLLAIMLIWIGVVSFSKMKEYN